MNSPILTEIERQKRAAQVAAWNRAEEALAEKLVPTAPIDLGPHKAHFAPFVEWCTKLNVRFCPAKPASITAYVVEHAHRGETFILDAIDAIEALHDYHQQSNPVATRPVRAALQLIVGGELPRWKKTEQLMFTTLPPEIRAAILRRESERDREVNRVQNELAKVKKSNAEEPKKETAATNGAERTSNVGEPSGAIAG